MSRHLRLASLVLFCATANSVAAQNGSPFVPTSILPTNTPMDEYAVTGDRNRVYYSSLNGEVFLYDRKTSKTTRISEGGNIWDVRVSNNGSAVAFTKSGEGGKDFVWTVPLDPTTGLAKGPQRRASMMPGDNAALSQDGRSLAFVREDSGGTSLVVLPALGGPEHVLASFNDRVDNIHWQPDGNSLVFLVHPTRRNTPGKASIQEISLNGGSPKTLAAARSDWFGLSPDGSLIAFGDTASRHSFVLADRTGRSVGTFTAPPGFEVDMWTNGKIVASRVRNLFRTHIYNLADGTSRVLVDSIAGASWPSWAPDGKQFAFAVSNGPSSELIMMNQAGSSGRSIRLERTFGHGTPWSPDGRWTFYSTAGLPTTVVAVEMATGKQVPLATSDRDVFARWADDSRSLLLVIGGQSGTTRSLSLREVDLTGASKELLQIPGSPGSYLFPLDRKSALVRRGNDRPLVLESLSGGRNVELLPATPGFSSGPIFSASGKWVAFRRNPQGNNSAVFSTIDVAKMDGSSHSSIELPFNISPGAAAFLPGDNQLIVSDRAPTDAKTFQFLGGTYLVTLATRDVKKLFTFKTFKNAYAQVSLSPDGKSILYTSRDSLPAGYATLDVSSFLKSKP